MRASGNCAAVSSMAAARVCRARVAAVVGTREVTREGRRGGGRGPPGGRGECGFEHGGRGSESGWQPKGAPPTVLRVGPVGAGTLISDRRRDTTRRDSEQGRNGRSSGLSRNSWNGESRSKIPTLRVIPAKNGAAAVVVKAAAAGRSLPASDHLQYRRALRRPVLACAKPFMQAILWPAQKLLFQPRSRDPISSARLGRRAAAQYGVRRRVRRPLFQPEALEESGRTKFGPT